MDTFGKIEVILNDRLALISSSESLSPNEVINVYAIIDDPKLKELGYPDPILYPKGELKIVSHQKDDKYLAESFRETHTRTRKVVVPSAFARSMSSVIAQLQPESREITEEIPGPWSAALNKSQSLNISTPEMASVGDLIGRIR